MNRTINNLEMTASHEQVWSRIALANANGYGMTRTGSTPGTQGLTATNRAALADLIEHGIVVDRERPGVAAYWLSNA